MNGSVNNLRLFPNIFHNINLAAIRPTDGVDVCCHHPKCGPNTLPARYLNARFYPTVLPRPFPFRQKSSGCVLPVAQGFATGLNH
jgi:hypothetical protein